MQVENQNLYTRVIELLNQARQNVAQTINNTMATAYFEIGRMIVEEEQQGKEKAEYGKRVLKELSEKLVVEFGKGFSETNLRQIRNFYLLYSIQQTVSAELGKDHTAPHEFKNEETADTVSRKSINQQTLSAQFKLTWSHYLKLMRIADLNERNFYEIEAIKNNWSLRELQRQYDSALYTRLALSKDKAGILSLGQEGQKIENSKDLIKDPYILEFLGLPEKSFYSESDLEQKLIDKLEHFLLELGNGFTFVARQKRITFEERHFKIDLVFYNRILKCFVLIDLKIGELKHQDIGQMQMYVNYFDREVKLEDENKTIGIILCQDKSESVVRYTLPENNEQIFASKYLTVLPSEKDFIKIIEN
ncbi:putative nuclease of restriction endonuclease-like (RecB) superfamily [Pedobacter sp. W3I1]|uniref:PDDEXK nuclease domain-containing protein n=1 Tax=Pedobacter sp. W3I1 TaxID=3042291 RepID=UPI00278800AC|nr:PDDEXK nuclease domain-containing protein [Pedobacter sp. W3I1]MDQ0637709.1 putative nuclease of restriction endonuclease-like (RecB) superfamily [Pedobacter sp. W3I1]